jgi:hypothetical protein
MYAVPTAKPEILDENDHRIISKIAWKPTPFDGAEGKAFLS